MHVPMQKLQIIFPDPLIERMRKLARQLDVPLAF